MYMRLYAIRRRALIGHERAFVGTAARVIVGAVMPAPWWAIRGGKTHLARGRIAADIR